MGHLRKQKRPGVLSCAVREAGIPPAVRARIQTEANSGLQRQQGRLCRLRLRIKELWQHCQKFINLKEGSEGSGVPVGHLRKQKRPERVNRNEQCEASKRAVRRLRLRTKSMWARKP